jgi:hypothetical protein
MADISNGNGNGNTPVDVLTERITNVSKRLDEQVIASQTAITVALATQEKAVSAAFLASEKALTAALSASEKAIQKSEAAQSEVNKVIAELTRDVISLRESRSQGSGVDSAKTTGNKQTNWMVGLAISTLFSLLTLASVVFYHFVK